jgi:hypothetical protein
MSKRIAHFPLDIVCKRSVSGGQWRADAYRLETVARGQTFADTSRGGKERRNGMSATWRRSLSWQIPRKARQAAAIGAQPYGFMAQ